MKTIEADEKSRKNMTTYLIGFKMFIIDIYKNIAIHYIRYQKTNM